MKNTTPKIHIRRDKIHDEFLEEIHIGPHEAWARFRGDGIPNRISTTRELILLIEALHHFWGVSFERNMGESGTNKFWVSQDQSGSKTNLFKYFTETDTRVGNSINSFANAQWVSSISIYKDGAMVLLVGSNPREIYVTELNSIAGLCWAMFARNAVGLSEAGNGFYLQRVVGGQDFPEVFRDIPEGEFQSVWLQAFAAIRF